MCGLCQTFQPWQPDCVFDPFLEAGSTRTGCVSVTPDEGSTASTTPLANTVPIYTHDQIADYLTTGFWASFGGPRSFDVSAGDTLLVDVSRLGAAGQTLAHQALTAWAEVTGIEFRDVTTSATVEAGRESADAPAASGTVYALDMGQYFLGQLSSETDRDWVSLSLVAGQTVILTLDGDAWSGFELDDPLLSVYDADGTLLAQDDDSGLDFDSRLVFTAKTTGVVFVEAASFGGLYDGGYRLSVTMNGEVADLAFTDDDAGAYTTFSLSGSTITQAQVNINANWTGGGSRTDGYHYQTYLHEIGHALGLGHAGPYNGSASYGTDNLYANDSWQTTVMSYFDQSENTDVGGSFAYAITPQVADIIALREIYGGGEARTGDTVYGFGSTAGGYLDEMTTFSAPTALTILDDGGLDTLDLGGWDGAQRIDLGPGEYSDVLGRIGTLGIAEGSIIENAIGGAGHDWIGGNAAANVLDGGAGNDALIGGAGNDTLEGGNGRDFLNAGEGRNHLSGGAGSDLLIGAGVSEAEMMELLGGLADIWGGDPDALA